MLLELAIGGVGLVVGLALLVGVVAIAVDDTRQDRARARAAVRLRETVPILPWPGSERDDVTTFQRENVNTSRTPAAVAAAPRQSRELARTDRGDADGDLIAGLAVLCAVVIFFAGGIVHGIGEAVTGWADDVGDALDTDKPRASRVTAERLRADLRQVDVVAELPDVPGYEREAFGSDWTDGRNGCDARNDVLARDLTDVRRAGDGCTVLSGRLHDPYTGDRIAFDRSDPIAVQVDHTYPLSAAWDAGASGWDETERVAFANDVARNLAAVDGPTNASKGDSSPAEWMPPNDAYACGYLHRYLRVAAAYDLPITTADAEVVRETAPHCRAGGKGGDHR